MVAFIIATLMVFDKTGVPIVDELGELKKELFEHEKMVRRMNVAVSLGKYAGLATSVMPFLICFLIYIIAPEYVTPFLKSQFAPLIVAVCSILVFLGIFFVFKLTRFNLKQIDGRICR